MQKDNHYHAILALCIRAGYSPDEARIVAFSNYQTDCTALTQVKRPWQLWINNPGRFFHFVEGKSGVVEANSDRVRDLVLNIPVLVDNGISYAATPDRLIALGIALHAFQDSYSHAGFVGRLDKRNEMGLKTSWWRRAIPHYGHTQMGLHPDRCEVTWTDTRTGEVRVNAEIFTDCMFELFNLIKPAALMVVIADITDVCLVQDYDERKAIWAMQAKMPDIRFSAIQADMWKQHGKAFKAAAKRQKEFLS